MLHPDVELDILPRAGDDRGAKIVPRCRVLDGFARESSGAEGVAIESLEAGTVLTVDTRNSHYRFVVLDGPHFLVVAKGGAMFPEATLVRLEGATAGGSALKLGWIVVGLKFEMSLGPRRITSSRVRSIAIEEIPSVRRTHLSVA